MECRISHVQLVPGGVRGHVGYSIRRLLDAAVRIYESAELGESLALESYRELQLLALVDVRLEWSRSQELNRSLLAIL